MSPYQKRHQPLTPDTHHNKGVVTLPLTLN
jgi:hypothetical protein